MDLTAIGAYISLLRRQRGLSQRELAARLGVSYQAVSKWENAENLPDAAILLPLAEALHTTADALLSAGTHRVRQPIDLNALHAGISALSTVMSAFGQDSPIGTAIDSTLYGMGIALSDPQGREQLLAEAILHRLQEGDTISDAALDSAIRDEHLLERIRKCRHDCALFADKQQIYDDCRPSWPEEALRFIRETVGDGAVIADIGSGTGKLALLCAPWAAHVNAVEPSAHMRRVLTARASQHPNVQVVPATAEATRLPDRSVDAITIAEAYHWFDNEQTRAELRRILKPGGRVFLLWNHFRDNAFDAEMSAINRQYRTSPRPPQRTGAQRADDLYGAGRWERHEFDNTIRQTCARFLGGMCSASYAPEAGTVDGEAFRRAARALFEKHAVSGLLTTHITTVCYAGTLPE